MNTVKLSHEKEDGNWIFAESNVFVWSFSFLDFSFCVFIKVNQKKGKKIRKGRFCRR